MKKEFKKFIISSLIMAFMLFYYNSSHFRGSISHGLNTTVFGMFEGVHLFLIGMSFYLCSYLVFNLVYMFFHILKKRFSIKYRLTTATSITLIFICVMIIINDQIIIQSTKDYNYVSFYFQTNVPDSIDINYNNFYHFEWSKKSIDYISPSYIINETLIFDGDSSWTLNGSQMVFDKLFLLRKLLNDKKDYTIRCESDHSITLMDSATSQSEYKIMNNKLYFSAY